MSGLLAVVLAGGVFWSETGDSAAMAIAAVPADPRPEVVIVSIANIDVPYETASAARADDPAAVEGPDLLLLLNAGAADKRVPVLPKFAADYRSLRRLAALIDLPRLRDGMAVTGIASTYNPYRDGPTEGGVQTASGEFYDPTNWTAAIQTNLRSQFGGVRYGRLYRPAYVLVECGDKQAIVKINDVGPLKPGRVIDLNERTMRYFDPFLRRGLLADVRVTLLPGEDWMPGPIGSVELVRYAGAL
ncbi:septal ring lytic transglycosylase RlpA family protein [Microbacteriaceae bacterium K1510]|nr:septal ring lytic transglycosylase RlpA family protein [Microbacteriaceae bacterium K1510]